MCIIFQIQYTSEEEFEPTLYCSFNDKDNLAIWNFLNSVDFLNNDRNCSLQIDEDNISNSFSFLFFFYLISIPLRCNHAALALVSVAKEKEEVIIWLEECHSFLFPIIQHYFCINNKVYYRFCSQKKQKKKKKSQNKKQKHNIIWYQIPSPKMGDHETDPMAIKS